MGSQASEVPGDSTTAVSTPPDPQMVFGGTAGAIGDLAGFLDVLRFCADECLKNSIYISSGTFHDADRAVERPFTAFDDLGNEELKERVSDIGASNLLIQDLQTATVLLGFERQKVALRIGVIDDAGEVRFGRFTHGGSSSGPQRIHEADERERLCARGSNQPADRVEFPLGVQRPVVQDLRDHLGVNHDAPLLVGRHDDGLAPAPVEDRLGVVFVERIRVTVEWDPVLDQERFEGVELAETRLRIIQADDGSFTKRLPKGFFGGAGRAVVLQGRAIRHDDTGEFFEQGPRNRPAYVNLSRKMV